MKEIPQLFGVNLPQTSTFQLKEKIRKLNRNLSQKHVLYFHYSEFLLRANRNPWYREILNRGNLAAIDGKGLHWAMWTVMRGGTLPNIYKSFFIHFPLFIRVPIFVILFFLQLIINLFFGFFSLVLKYNYTPRTKNQVILGRDFVYDLLKIAEEKKFKTMVIGGSGESDEITKNLINKIFPSLNLTIWSRSYNSLLMKDQVLPEFVGETLNSENVCQFFPDLWEAKKAIKDEKPDLVLVCLGGSSGRQEFFIDNIYQDPEMEFLLATGLGAAFDHLGGGAKQSVAPNWMIKSGLEWLHRVIHQPYRRKRVLDSIVTLWWWTTLQQFTQNTQSRPTVINILSNKAKEILLVKRRNILPGDVGWTFVQGGIESKELPEIAGIREIEEEVKLEKNKLQAYLPSTFSDKEPYSVSFLRFIALGAKYDSSKNYLNFVEYSGETSPVVNWENMEARWFDHREVMSMLSVEKRKDWTKAIEVIKHYEEI
jgi:exopolysaccharide biosynthesis WecB/TagA/CpsF family protein